MNRSGPTPELGNLAWAPQSTLEKVDILDRFNGVPTLGVVYAGDESYLFWRVFSDDGETSAWLYVPLSQADHDHLDADDDSDFLDSIVFNSAQPRYVTAGVASQNRLIFEREWRVPANLSADDVGIAFMEYVIEALRVALEQEPPLPGTRRQVVQNASDAVRHLAIARS